MGAFYTSITLAGPAQADVARAMTELGREGIVSPRAEGAIVVWDAQCEWQDVAELDSLAATLSRTHASPALAALVHDSDLLLLRLFEHGELRDAYDSAPGYFDDDADEEALPTGGNARLLCAAFGIADEERVAALERLLRMDADEAGAFVEQRHAEIASSLGLPEFAAGLGYNYVSEELEGEDAMLAEGELAGCVRTPQG